MPSRGDITAGEVYADREMLNRLGYGIFDVTFGPNGVGFENVKDFSYVVAQDEDPKLYRRKVFDLIGRYYPNKLAKLMWDKFVDHKWVLSEKEGQEVSLRAAAQDWFDKYGHQFLKEWTFQQPEVPVRLRNQNEPNKSLLGMLAGTLVPNIRELLDAGFSVVDVARAAIAEAANPGIWKEVPRPKKPLRRLSFRPRLKAGLRPKKTRLEDGGTRTDKTWKDGNKYFTIQKIDPLEIAEGRYYAQLVANLTGHEPTSKEEAERRWREILEHKWYMSERAGHDVGLQTAALDYFRRLNLLKEAENGYEG